MDEDTPKRGAHRANKPLTEKRRRLRINASLEQIKCLIMDAIGQDPSSVPTKFEKADILELAVRYLQNQRLTSPSGDMVNQYKEGYQACIRDVSSYLTQSNNVEPKFKGSVVEHLDQCFKTLNSGNVIADMVRSRSQQNLTAMDFVDGSMSAQQPLQDLNQNIVRQQQQQQHQQQQQQQQNNNNSVKVHNNSEQPVQVQEKLVQQNDIMATLRLPHVPALQFDSNAAFTSSVLGLPPIQSFAPAQQAPTQVYDPLMERQEVTETRAEESYQTFTVLQPVKQERAADRQTQYYGLYPQDQGFV